MFVARKEVALNRRLFTVVHRIRYISTPLRNLRNELVYVWYVCPYIAHYFTKEIKRTTLFIKLKQIRGSVREGRNRKKLPNVNEL